MGEDREHGGRKDRRTLIEPVTTPWSESEDRLLADLDTTRDGLTDEAARLRRRADESPFIVRRNTDLELMARQLKNPVVVLLALSAALSMVLADVVEASIIILILVVSGALGFWQERGATRAVAALAASVEIGAEVTREGRRIRVGVDQVVPGDVVVLNAGDVVPADGRVIEANRLQVNEANLTGENYPRRKEPGISDPHAPPALRSNWVLMGTHVASGEGRMVVAACGSATEFGQIVSGAGRVHLPTSFERGITRYGTMLASVAGALVAIVLVVNLSLGRAAIDSVLFSLALAVGMTPQMLPAIVTLSMSRGARMLATERVIVKRLDAIEDIGSVQIVCTDKTGTLTEGNVELVGAYDSTGQESDEVLRLVHWNAHLQRGFDNPIDEAIVARVGHSSSTPPLLHEIPFDFQRRMVSVVIRDPDGPLLVAKGNVEEVLRRCSEATDRAVIRSVAVRLETMGDRVLAVATRRWTAELPPEEYVESDLDMVGFVRFADPVKVGAADAIGDLASLGVTVKMITGDSRIAALRVARAVGLADGGSVTGELLESVSDDELRRVVAANSVFAEVDPLLKERIVRALSSTGNAVAFLGDGINDVAGLHAADVGISVDRAADAARQVADLVLLDKDLGVLAEGIRLGRRVFVNTLKYVNVTTSANFGNMLSLALATAYFPYLPMLPLQILLLNFLSDIPAMTIATDSVDPEMIARPVAWETGRLARFMVTFGFVSTVADLVCLAGLGWWFDAPVEVVRTGWFVESCLTEIVVLLALRTRRPMWRSRPSAALLRASGFVATVCIAIPWAPQTSATGFSPLGLSSTAWLAALILAYLVATELLKRRRGSLLPGAESATRDDTSQ